MVKKSQAGRVKRLRGEPHLSAERYDQKTAAGLGKGVNRRKPIDEDWSRAAISENSGMAPGKRTRSETEDHNRSLTKTTAGFVEECGKKKCSCVTTQETKIRSRTRDSIRGRRTSGGGEVCIGPR